MADMAIVRPEKRKDLSGRTSAILRELPTYQTFDYKTVTSVRAALANQLTGQFLGVADVMENMMMDPRIRSAISTRINGLLGLPIDFDPQGDGRRKRAVARELEDAWKAMLPVDQAAQVIISGLFLGLGIGQLVWQKTDTRWTPSLRYWNARHAYWRWDTDSYWVSTMEGQVEMKPGDGQWVLFTPYGYRRGWVMSLVRALAIPWMVRTYAVRDWARHSEVHGMPTRKAEVPSTADEVHKERFFEAVVSLANEPTILLEKNQDGTLAYDVELLEAATDSWEVFAHLIEQTDKDIAILTLGQNLTTEISKGGSRAAAQVHDGVRLDYCKADNESWSSTTQEQVIRPWAALNFGGDPDLAPKPTHLVEPPEDMSEKATTLQALGAGLASLKQTAPRLDVDEVLETFDLPLLTEEEAAAEKQQRMEDAAANADMQAEAAGNPKTATASARPSDSGSVRGQTYIDAVADHSKTNAGKLLASDVEALLEIVAKGSSYEEIRKHLVAHYKVMDPDRLAELTEKAILLSRLAGMNAVIEDL